MIKICKDLLDRLFVLNKLYKIVFVELKRNEGNMIMANTISVTNYLKSNIKPACWLSYFLPTSRDCGV